METSKHHKAASFLPFTKKVKLRKVGQHTMSCCQNAKITGDFFNNQCLGSISLTLEFI